MSSLLNSIKITKEAVIIAVVIATVFSVPHIAEAACAWGELEALKLPFLGDDGERDICELIGSYGTGTSAITKILAQLVIVVMALVLMAAAVGIVIGGYIYMTAGGSADRVQLAKTWIIAALLGITIALTAWVMLNIISPTLT